MRPPTVFPKSAQQLQLEALRRSRHEAPAMLMLRLEGPLHVPALNGAVRLLTEDHSALRMGLTAGGQEIRDEARIFFHEGACDGAEEIMDLARETFPHMEPGSLGVCLFRRNEAYHYLALVLPAGYCDLGSFQIAARHLAEKYRESYEGGPEYGKPIGYEDYIRWQEALRENPELAEWTDYELALREQPQKAVATPYLPCLAAVHLSEEADQALVSAAQRLACSELTLSYVLWQVLLSRYHETYHYLMAIAFDGRPFEELDEALGLFQRYMPLSPLNVNQDLPNMVKQIRSRLEQLFELQDYQGLEASDDVLLPRFGFCRQRAWDVHHVGPLTFTVVDCDHQTQPFELELWVRPNEELGTNLRLRYNRTSYAPQVAKDLLARFEKMLIAVGQAPEISMDQPSLLLPHEEKALLLDFNRTADDAPMGRPVHRIFEDYAVSCREQTALVFGDHGAVHEQHMSYGELNEKANRLAHYLLKKGAGPDKVIALCFERSLEHFLCLLAALKSGGAFLPLDPALPDRRLAMMLADAGADLLLTSGDQHARFSVKECFCPKRDWQSVADLPAGNPTVSPDMDHLAYVVYTSGSTGRPKGVMITHHNLFNYIDGLRRTHLPEEGESHAVVSSLYADLGHTTVFGALCGGGTLHVLSTDLVGDADLFGAWFHKHGIDHLKITPTHLAALMEGEQPQRVLPRKKLFVGGEASRTAWVAGILETAPGLSVINHYGPSEATVGMLTLAVNPKALPKNHHLPLGTPLKGTSAYVLDQVLNPVPPGVPGELHIGGAGLARGYLNRAGQTAERFIPAPRSCGGPLGSRLYKTGDLVRFGETSPHLIEFLGRVDFQVKIRGFRIELGEVEAGLLQQPHIQEALVTAHGDGDALMLVAYVVCNREIEALQETTNRALSEILPNYMIPSVLIPLSCLPINVNGKIDRNALPDPREYLVRARRETTPAQTPLQKGMAAVWEGVLGLTPGLEDNFFAMGGNSLTGTVLISRINACLGGPLALASLFQNPSLKGLTEALLRRQLESVPSERIGAFLNELGQAWNGSLDALSREQREELAEQLAGQGVVGTIPGRSSSGTNVFPLSFAQQRLWFLQQLEPGASSYNAPVAFRLEGELSVEALDWSIACIVERHETLRTTFHEREGQPVQVIGEASTSYLAVENLSGLPADEREEVAGEHLAAVAARPFCLKEGPLFRVTLFILEDRVHLLSVVMHHIVSDAWSMGILVRELEQLYTAAIGDRVDPLPPPAIQYADYAVWQRRSLEGTLLDKQLAYWSEQLVDLPVVHQMPLDFPRPPKQTYDGATVPVSVNNPEAVRALAEQMNATVFMVFHGVFACLLARYSGQNDIVIGTPIANRNHSETEPLIGFFVNNLVLRTNLAGNPRFREVLTRIRQTDLDAYAHQDAPFDYVVDMLQPERNLNHGPLFQIALVLQNARSENFRIPGIRIEALSGDQVAAKYDLVLTINESAEQMGGSIIFNTRLFEEETIRNLAQHFGRLLQALVADPDLPVEHIDLLTPEERRLRHSWSVHAVPEFLERELIDLFHEAVDRNPDRVAVRHEGVETTYADVDRYAEGIAAMLRERGLCPGKTVGIFMDRCLEGVVTTLAVLKTGCAFLPLPPDYPRDRLTHVVTNSQTDLLVATRRHQPPELPVDLLVLPQALPTAERVARAPLPDLSPAYIIYTSGSTGRPKGAALSRLALVNLCRWYNHFFEIGPGTPVIQVFSPGFDASVKNILAPLLVGAHTVLFANGPFDASRLLSTLETAGVEVMNCVPGMFYPLLERLQERDYTPLSKLRYLAVGGEAFDPARFQSWQQDPACRCRVVNIYGPTEAADSCLAYKAPAEELRPGHMVPIGSPTANAGVYILNHNLDHLPAGVAGELMIAGSGLASCYLGQPAQTAQQFIPNPFGDGTRLYRTGDGSCWRPNGLVRFLGRLDHQIKIRGFRIELSEIENRIREHEDIRDVVVVYRPNQAQHALVAYLIAVQGVDEAVLRPQLRDWLGRQLPPYMVPTGFTFLDEFPKTPSGKLDRRALPLPEREDEEHAFNYIAPTTPAARKMAAIWQDVLERDVIGMGDNFFLLGGHSLLATRLIYKVSAGFGVDLALRSLFNKPTPAGLLEEVEATFHKERHAPPPLTVHAGDGPFTASFAQRRLWFLNRLGGDQTIYNQAGALMVTGPLNGAFLSAAWLALLHRHQSLCSTFAEDGVEPHLVFLAPASMPMGFMDFSDREPGAAQEAALEVQRREASAPFDLATGPLARLTLLKQAPDKHMLLVTMHHIISDGASMRIMVRDLIALYRACDQGQDPQTHLPPLPFQYVDFAAWQRGLLNGDVLNEQIRYWTMQLAGAPECHQVPLDYPRPAVQTYRGTREHFQVEPGLTAALLKLSRDEGTTLFSCLQTAFALLLSRYSDMTDICIGTSVSNRRHKDLEQVIGLLLNQLVFRFNLHPQEHRESFSALLRRSSRSILDAMDHGDVPFEHVVEVLQPQRSRSHSPLFQIMFDMEHAAGPVSEVEVIEDLSFQTFPGDYRISRFDLTLSTVQAEDRLHGSFEYNTDLFAPATIRRLIGHYQQLLGAIATGPEQAFGYLSIMGETERRQLLYDWNAVSQTPAPPHCLHQWFERVALAHPERTAVAAADDDRPMSYETLNVRANNLAHHLRDMGVSPGALLGVCLPRSADMIVALLGILKAGAAYVPLDPDHPLERLSLIINDTGMGTLVVHEDTVDELPSLEINFLSTIFIDESRELIAASGDGNPDLDLSLDYPAYVLYTSGSTGRPKGVVVPHRGVVNYLNWALELYEIDKHCVSPLHGPLTFDATITSLWAPLMAGGCIHPLAGDQVFEDLAEQLAGVATHAKLTPAHLELLARMVPEPQCSARTFVVGGEALAPSLVHLWQTRADKPRILNEYGPTETVVGCSAYVADALPQNADKVPIGRPAAGMSLYLLDAAQQPVPTGGLGEIHVGGVSLAQGYLRQAGLTASRFVPNPFGSPGSRLYRTGDLGRMGTDLEGKPADLIFCGRRDHQVKLRGYRIELGEIEALFHQQSEVGEAVVVLREDTPGDQNLVAYLTLNPPASPEYDGGALEQRFARFLGDRLPDYMVPRFQVFLNELPLTANGKLDRKALPRPTGGQQEEALLPPETSMERILSKIWCELLQVDQIGIHTNFFDAGGHSLLLAQVHSRLEEKLGTLPMVELFQYPTIHSLATFLEKWTGAGTEINDQRRQVRRKAQSDGDPIAVIGISGRFPGAADPNQFWENLRNGVNAISFFSREALLDAGITPATVDHPDYVPANGVMDEVAMFDAAFFDISPREGEIMDPQHRWFLTCAWEALEYAGVRTDRCGPVGIYGGIGLNHYLMNNLLGHPELLGAVNMLQGTHANDKDYVTTRVSYKLDLRGPGINVQTACSTGLVAVHLACNALRHGECELAIAGGVSLKARQITGHTYQQGMILSPDGYCRAFDAKAAGTMGGSGAAFVVLQPLSTAREDHHHVLALILGGAVNNDGAARVGYTAPGVDGQASVIKAALDAAGVPPQSISYVEAHGTGTPLGDPIEVRALNQAYAAAADRNSIALGSVKTNIGHLNTAAGVAGLIKVILALGHRQIPQSLNFSEPNPAIDFAGGPFFVNRELRDWLPAMSPDDQPWPRRAGISSFGIGGTNAHLIVEEAPPPASQSQDMAQLLLFSARSDTALARMHQNLMDHADTHPDLDPAHVAYTLQMGRRPFERRRFLVRNEGEPLSRALADHARTVSGTVEPCEPVFLFPGQGSQHRGMSEHLYQRFPVFKEAVDHCAACLRPLIGRDLQQVMWHEEDGGQLLKQTRYAQVALFVVEYAYAKLWLALGVKPVAMIGHSLGEFAAACLAGVFSLEDALSVVSARGRLMAECEPGVMLSISCAAEKAAAYLGDELDMACINGPTRCVAGGPDHAVRALEERLKRENIACRRLVTSHAFHSRTMAPAVAPFVAILANVVLHEPSIPFISNVTGTWITAAQATDPHYWARQLREPVDFSRGMSTLFARGKPVFIEVGPGRALFQLAQSHPDRIQGQFVLPGSPVHDQGDGQVTCFLNTLGRLWLQGLEPNWEHLGGDRHMVPLPTYPFDYKHYWIDPPIGKPAAPRVAKGVKQPREQWLYRQTRRLLEPCPPRETGATEVLVFISEGGLGARLADLLEEKGHRVSRVFPGACFENTAPHRWRLNPSSPEDYRTLIAAFTNRTPAQIIHAWSLLPAVELDEESLRQGLTMGFYSLLYLAQALHENTWNLTILSCGLLQDDPQPRPESAPLIGPTLVIPRENPDLHLRYLNVDRPAHAGGEKILLNNIIAELGRENPPVQTMLRGRTCWQPVYEALPWPAAEPSPPAAGTYLITGGMGRMGLVIARELIRNRRGKVVLLGRSPRDDARLRQLLEVASPEILYYESVDLCDPAQLEACLDRIIASHGSIRGVYHGAGLTGKSIMVDHRELCPSVAEEIFAAKIHGLVNLERAFRGREPAFFMLMSSLSTELGGLGYSAYAGANRFMDGFAAYMRDRSPAIWQSISWDGWNFAENREKATGLSALTIFPEDAPALLAAIAARSDLHHILVATHDLEDRYQRWVSGKLPVQEKVGQAHARPDLTTDFLAPRTGTEQVIASIWQRLLGLEAIGIYDNFLELGGDSLTATQVFSQLKAETGINLPLSALFDEPTIAGLAGILDAAGATGEQSEEDLDEDRIGGML